MVGFRNNTHSAATQNYPHVCVSVCNFMSCLQVKYPVCAMYVTSKYMHEKQFLVNHAHRASMSTREKCVCERVEVEATPLCEVENMK